MRHPESTMEKQGKLGQWLKEKCEKEHLSLRQVAIKTGVSHQTIAGLIDGKKALPTTIKRLAHGFGGNGKRRLALEDKLLVLAGYRTERPREKLSEPLAQLIDKEKQLNETQLKMMGHFADFLIEIEEKIKHEATP
ncbi:unnamed protein product [marine sediment metagenome]|uniref:HTH cro/C1-type domain-containing protein n=1 Tax=marine sediment metagenome TaxID=412755 RepID=X1VA25_9ZZZZ